VRERGGVCEIEFVEKRNEAREEASGGWIERERDAKREGTANDASGVSINPD
jgi:hypothetical protein